MPKVFIAIGVVILLAIIAWIVWPSPYSKVKNLMSPGTAIIAFGDSLTAGYGAQAGEDYPTVLSRLIHLPVINAGVSGDTTEAALARIDRDVLPRDPRIVIVGLGGNDFLRGIPIATTESNLRTIVAKIQRANAMVVLLSFSFPSLTENYESMYERVGKESGCLVVKGVLRGILTDATLKSDAIHPNARGYAKMADRIASPVNKLLRKSNAALGR